MSGSFNSVLVTVLLWLVVRFVRLLPECCVFQFGRTIGSIAFVLAHKHRRLAFRNLRLAYGDEKSPSEMRRTVLRTFMNMGLNVVDFCRVPWLHGKGFRNCVRVEGYENLAEALKKGKGAVLLTAHLGSWELMAAAGAPLGLSLFAIVSSTGDPLVDRFMKRMRESRGYRTLPKHRAVYSVVSRLKQNAVVGILADVSPRHDGVLVRFFGKVVGATKGPAVFALRSDAPVIPTFIVRLAQPARHKIIFEKPVELVKTGDRETDIAESTQRFHAIIERYVRRYPDQWLWMQKR